MPRAIPARPLLLAAVAVVALAGCGDDTSDDGAPEEYVEASVEAIEAEYEDPSALGDGAVECLVRAALDPIPLDDLEALGTAEEVATGEAGPATFDYSEEQADEVESAMEGCDLSVADFTRADGREVDDQLASCIDEALDDEEVAVFFASGLTGSSEGDELLERLVEDCEGFAG